MNKEAPGKEGKTADCCGLERTEEPSGVGLAGESLFDELVGLNLVETAERSDCWSTLQHAFGDTFDVGLRDGFNAIEVVLCAFSFTPAQDLAGDVFEQHRSLFQVHEEH